MKYKDFFIPPIFPHQEYELFFPIKFLNLIFFTVQHNVFTD